MRTKVLILGLICLCFMETCDKKVNNPYSPKLPSPSNPNNPAFYGFADLYYVYGTEISDLIVIYWSALVTNMTTHEAGIIQIDKSIYHWDGNLYETEVEMPIIWTGTSYYDPPLILPLTYNIDSPSSYRWKEIDTDIPHPGYLPNRGKVIFYIESEGQIYILETELQGIYW